jgi:hypothetical protein
MLSKSYIDSVDQMIKVFESSSSQILQTYSGEIEEENRPEKYILSELG